MSEEVLNAAAGTGAQAPSVSFADSSLPEGAIVTPTRTLEMVTAEIRYLDEQGKRIVAWYTIELGRKLTEAKALVPHGEWGRYIREELGFSLDKAEACMKIFDGYGAAQQSLFGPEIVSDTYRNLDKSKLLALLDVPVEEREEFAETVDAEHLSVRELKQAIRERDEARKKAAALEQELEGSLLAISEAEEQRDAAIDKLMSLDKSTKEQQAEDRDTIKTLEAKITELESRPIDVAVQEPDPDAVEKLAAELANKAKEELEQQAAKEVGAAEEKAAKAAEALKKAQEKAKAEREKLEAQLKEAEGKLAAAGEADKAEAEKLRAEAEALRKQLAMSSQEIVIFKLRFSAWQEAHKLMAEAFAALGDEETKEKMRAAIRAQIKAWGWAE